MRCLILGGLLLGLCGCASGGASNEVAAVVQTEAGRQAAVEAAQDGESSKHALKAGAAAAATEKAKTDPPI